MSLPFNQRRTLNDINEGRALLNFIWS